MKLHENSVVLIREQVYEAFKHMIGSPRQSDDFRRAWEGAEKRLEKLDLVPVPGTDLLGVLEFKNKG